MKTILTLAFEAGIRPFDMIPTVSASSRSVGDLAANLLHGRNSYFDKEYRDRFGTKVHTVEIMHGRLVLGAVESAQPADTAKPRRYRAVLFRCDGEVLYQTPDNRSLDSLNAATVDMRYWASQINDATILKDLCTKQLRIAERMKTNTQRVLDALAQAKGPLVLPAQAEGTTDFAETKGGGLDELKGGP